MIKVNNKDYAEMQFGKVNNKDYAVGIYIAKTLGYKSLRDAILRYCKGVVIYDGG